MTVFVSCFPLLEQVKDRMRLLALLAFLASSVLVADESRLFEVKVGKVPLFYAEVLQNGDTYKAYPKPRVKIGKFSDANGELKFTTEKEIRNDENVYPLIANVFRPADLVDEDKDILRALVFESEGAEARLAELPGSEVSKDLEVEKWTGREVELDWKNIRLVAVPKEEREKIEAFEKALLGKWKFVRATDKVDDEIENAPQYRTIEFCPDGQCIVDKDKKFFWSDGRFARLSFQKTDDWKLYDMKEEYDVVRPDEDKLVLKSLPMAEILFYSPLPSRYKLKEVGENYWASDMNYYFERVKK